MWWRRFERALILLSVVVLVIVPTALHGWPTTARGVLFVVLVTAGAASLAWWRRDPRVSAVLALTLFLTAVAVGDGWFPDTGVVFYSASFAVLAAGWSGRASWVVAVVAGGYVALFSTLAQMDSWVAALMFSVPPFAAGTVLRLRKETADLLAVRARELEEERELYAQIVLRHERTRIAGELHDIVGHAISVMVIQAAAGQRLAVADPDLAGEAFAAISESARQGTRDLERLLELLGDAGDAGRAGDSGDLSLLDEMVDRATRSGLSVTCRFEGDRTWVGGPAAHLAYRVVQESLTNALRYAPGAAVRIVVRIDASRGAMDVRVDNDPSDHAPQSWAGSGRGLVGLRERLSTLGGELTAGAAGGGGWSVEARLPVGPPGRG